MPSRSQEALWRRGKANSQGELPPGTDNGSSGGEYPPITPDAPLGAPVSMYANAAPGGSVASDTQEITFGARIHPLLAGGVQSIKWYRASAAASAKGIIVLWNMDGTVVAAKQFDGISGTGWKSIDLPCVLPLDITKAYISSVYKPVNVSDTVYYQALANDFATTGKTASDGSFSMPPSDGTVVRGYAQRNNLFNYYDGNPTLPDDHFNGGNYYVDCGYVRGTIPAKPEFLRGYPDATNTGILPGSTLTPHAGELHVTTNGAVIQNLDISGRVHIEATNVTIRNCKARSGGTNATGVIYVNPSSGNWTGTRVLNCDLFGDNTSDGVKGVIINGGEVAFCNIYGSEDGISFYGDNGNYHDNYIHDLSATANADPHFDGIVTDGNADNWQIVHNTIFIPSNGTSCCNINNYFGNVVGGAIRDNLCDYGSYSILIDGRFTNTPGSIVDDIEVTNNITFRAGNMWFPLTDLSATNVIWTGHGWLAKPATW
jgi:hypothetical protein